VAADAARFADPETQLTSRANRSGLALQMLTTGPARAPLTRHIVSRPRRRPSPRERLLAGLFRRNRIFVHSPNCTGAAGWRCFQGAFTGG
jgi:hypothetical protein